MSLTPTTDSSHARAWEVELDRLELDVIRAQRLVQAVDPVEHVHWRPPALVGPMPEHLLPRARDILERQTAVLAEMVPALQRTERHRRFADQAVADTHGGPVYIDVSA